MTSHQPVVLNCPDTTLERPVSRRLTVIGACCCLQSVDCCALQTGGQMRRHRFVSHRARSQKSKNRPNPIGTAGAPRHGAASAIRWLPARGSHAVPPRRRAGTLGLVAALVISVLTVVGGKSAVAVVGGTTPAYLP